MLPPPSTVNILHCSKHTAPLPLLPLHVHIHKSGLRIPTSLASHLRCFCLVSGNVLLDSKLFDSLGNVLIRDTCWYSLIDGYVKCGEWANALHMYQKIRADFPLRDGYAIVSLLKACSKLKDMEMGTIIHSDICTSELLETNPFVSSAIVDMYANCNSLSRARQVFESLRARNTVTWNVLIAGYVRQEHHEEALDLFEQMQARKVPPDAVTFSCILKACGSIAAVDKGGEIYGEVYKLGLLKNEFVGNGLIDMYSKCNLLGKAREVLEMLPARDVVSWNTLIAGYMRLNCNEEVLSCLEQMQAEGISPDYVSYICTLKACGSMRARDRGREVHAHINQLGLWDNDLLLGTALVDMYAKCGMLAEAQDTFDKLPAHDVVAWSALILGYAQHTYGEEALHCFEMMQSRGFSPNAVTYAAVLKACGILGASEYGANIHDTIEREGLVTMDKVVGNALVDMYAKAGLVTKAREVFKKLPVRTLVSWTAMMTAYSQLGEVDILLELLEKMEAEDIDPNPVTFLCLLNACSHAGLVDTGQSFFVMMFWELGITPALEHITCIIDLLRRAGRFDQATRLMISIPSQIDTVTCLALMDACKQGSNIELGCHAFGMALQLNERATAAYVSMRNILARGVG